MSAPRRTAPEAPSRRGWCPGLARPMPTGDGLIARLHPAGGALSAARLRAIAEAARRFGNGHVDVTARANLQVRGVREDTRRGLAAFLEAAGLGDARRDGGPQRLTLTHPLAGLDPAERFDVGGLARAVEARGLAVPGLPAKTLVVIEGERRRLGETGADIRVRACGPDRAAIGLATADGTDWIGIWDAADIAAAVGAILAALARTGRRRVRDLSPEERAGVSSPCGAEVRSSAADGLAGAPSPVRERVGVRDATSPDASYPSPGALRALDLSRTGEVAGASARVVAPPPRDLGALPAGLVPLGLGGVAVAVEAPFGRCDADGLDRLAEIADTLARPEIRLSPSRGFVLATPEARTAAGALAALAGAGFITDPGDPRRAVAACPGAPACASGSTPTLVDAARLAEAFRPFAARGLSAHVSGCAKGCARPGAADLALVGADGLYGVVPGGAPGAEPAMQLTFEAALERVRRADPALGLAHAFRT
ncbi:precorrin-3B synthase [Methylobacterium nigriterrae]|uniref:precorrin-3B synthase n=1 Tax=Methylobacterium nigriterrae TaxID=3127512 RepID=UPI0030133492